MLLLKETKDLKEKTVSKFYDWTVREVQKQINLYTHNMPDFNIASIPYGIIFDIFLGYAVGC